jgi:TRAP-type mannitol/chloroaromatic compound transport system permease small subunit
VPNLLKLSRLIDRLNAAVGRWIAWLVLAAVLISAGNAVVRKLFNTSSNAFLEIQWYLFAAVFLLVAGDTLRRQAHVRIDVLSARLSIRTQAWIDICGVLLFLLPLVVTVIWLSWPIVARAYATGEMSSNAGGLIRWPVLALLPLGFALLGLQGLSELIKRVAWLRGLIADPVTGQQVTMAGEDTR